MVQQQSVAYMVLEISSKMSRTQIFNFTKFCRFFGGYIFLQNYSIFFLFIYCFGIQQSKNTLSNSFFCKFCYLQASKNSKMSPTRISCSNNENITSFVLLLVKNQNVQFGLANVSSNYILRLVQCLCQTYQQIF